MFDLLIKISSPALKLRSSSIMETVIKLFGLLIQDSYFITEPMLVKGHFASGNGIIATSTPWMTTGNSFYCKPKTFEYPMLFKCLNRIGRTRRREPAFRTKYRRNDPLINFY